MRCRSGADQGTATAETAVALPGLALVLAVSLAAVQAVATHLACVDAARIGARALARGEPDTAVLSLVAQVAPDQAETDLSVDGEFARVTVRAPVHLGPGATAPVIVGGAAATPAETRN
ncbi:MAG: pilus assembly protein [Nocardiopsaceae bacterium]|nr:pilus assembly protein [Nocardiopsaceae bacterium]